MRIQFYDKENRCLSVWHNVNPQLHFIPNVGDDVLLHFGDYKEEEREYTVISRTISGTNMDILKVRVSQIYAKEGENEDLE